MKKCILTIILCLIAICIPSHAQTSDNGDIYLQKLSKNRGEVISVDTATYCFTIKDEAGIETKFFAPMMKLKNINKGENIQVSYKKTTDGNLKALGIKPLKKKIRKPLTTLSTGLACYNFACPC